MATVRLDGSLREFGPRVELDLAASNLGMLLDGLEAQYPRLRSRIRDDAGTVRRSVRVFVNGQELPRTREMEAPLSPGDRVDFVPALPGG